MTAAKATVSWSGRHAVVAMPPEIDMSNSAQLGDLLSEVISEEPDLITADLTGTMFCDSAGIHAIVRANQQARTHGAELRLAVGQARVIRVLELTGLDRLMPVYRDVQQSLSQPSDGTGAR